MNELAGIGAERMRELAPQPGSGRELREAAQDFEAIFLRQLLSLMRRSVPEGDPDLAAPGREIYESMVDEAFAESMARSGRGLGLAEMLLAQLSGGEEEAPHGP